MNIWSQIFPANKKDFPCRTVLLWPESTTTRWWVTGQRAGLQGPEVAADLRERKISQPFGVGAVDSKAVPASLGPSKGNLQECMHGASRLDLG